MTDSIDRGRLYVVCRKKCKFTDVASHTDLICVILVVYVLLERERESARASERNLNSILFF